MGFSNVYLVLFLVHCAFSGPVKSKLCQPGMDPSTCVSLELEKLFRGIIKGNNTYDLKPTDPIIIPTLEIHDEELRFKSKYSNMQVTGFKDVVVSNVKGDQKSGQAEMTLKFNFVSESDITIIFNSGKTFMGTVKHEGDVEGDIKYIVNATKENNKEHFDVGPETIVCRAENVKFILDPVLQKSIKGDVAAMTTKPNFEDKRKKHLETIACSIGKIVLETAIGNLRKIVEANL